MRTTFTNTNFSSSLVLRISCITNLESHGVSLSLSRKRPQSVALALDHRPSESHGRSHVNIPFPVVHTHETTGVTFLNTFKSTRVRVQNTFDKKGFEYFPEYFSEYFLKQKLNKILPYLE